MAVRPAAELDVTPALAARLVAEQHPDLADLPVRLVTSGWDNAVLRLGEDLAVRMPRREAAARLVLHEQRWLPEIGPLLGVACPVPVRTGVPSPEFPWAWSIVPWFVGSTVATIEPGERSELAAPLADVLARLHRPAPADAPWNPVRGVDIRTRDAAVRERLASGSVPEASRVARLWDELLDTPRWQGVPVWVHGDPHAANLLVSAGRLSAVLDFGDLTAGDPATDLATAWMTFDAAGRQVFRDRTDAWGGTDEALWRRARAWALVMGTAMVAHSDDDPDLARMGAHALDQVLRG
ncbi:aminoglycoside phosphotransferase family protein [Cellulomonas sp. P22]|uniref:aminoglycoside phosphotransferase family protein n=1 Tax=Cellulomonas sp. P22 TaxID=3373189 RepID=UPI0037BB7AFF